MSAAIFNLGTPPLNDVRVRQAINYAIDRDAFGKATGGLYAVADMLLPAQHWAYDKALAGHYKHDPEQAKQAPAAAGHADGVDLAWFTYNDQAWQQRAEVLIEQLKAAISACISPVPQTPRSLRSSSSRRTAM